MRRISTFCLVAGLQLLSTPSSATAEDRALPMSTDRLTVNGRFQVPVAGSEKKASSIKVGLAEADQTGINALRTTEVAFSSAMDTALRRSFTNYGYSLTQEQGEVADPTSHVVIKYRLEDAKITTSESENAALVIAEARFSFAASTDGVLCQTFDHTAKYTLHNTRPLKGLSAFGSGLESLFSRNSGRLIRRKPIELDATDNKLERAWDGIGEGVGDFKKDYLAVREATTKAVQLSLVNILYQYNRNGECS